MKPIAHIYAKSDGTFDIAAVPMRKQDLAQILLALTSAVLKQLDAPSGNITLADAGPDKPPTVVLDAGENDVVLRDARIEGIDATVCGRTPDGPSGYQMPHVVARE